MIIFSHHFGCLILLVGWPTWISSPTRLAESRIDLAAEQDFMNISSFMSRGLSGAVTAGILQIVTRITSCEIRHKNSLGTSLCPSGLSSTPLSGISPPTQNIATTRVVVTSVDLRGTNTVRDNTPAKALDAAQGLR